MVSTVSLLTTVLKLHSACFKHDDLLELPLEKGQDGQGNA